ncbi:NB-ARC domain-containing protein [Streptomyces phaeochromogenes]|uniref:NB-ARC domain-containing protein n=1 Tax=Streptomyces phaeochromogenes TaxID=1923 RepID=UPI00386405F3|nr:NB-ARC domain-containing protein [Streptomyces phaeochromogenes]
MEPSRIPARLDAQAGLYRSLLTGRRMLVVLDNARDAEQVRPLLPGAPGCMALATSRRQLTGLAAAEDAHLLTLGLLSRAEALDLLTILLGLHRTAADPEAIREIIDRCAGLPLALAIVAARAAAQPGLPLARLAQELRLAESRLDALDGGDPASRIRAVFSWSYRALHPEGANLFRLLGLHPGPDIGLPAAAALAGVPVAELRAPLTELVRGHLLAEPAAGRYSFHGLLRAYAAGLVATHDDAVGRAATRRVLDHYLHTAHRADVLLTPQPHPELLPRPTRAPRPRSCRTISRPKPGSRPSIRCCSPPCGRRRPPDSTPTPAGSPRRSPRSSTGMDTGGRWPPYRQPPWRPRDARRTRRARPRPTVASAWPRTV